MLVVCYPVSCRLFVCRHDILVLYIDLAVFNYIIIRVFVLFNPSRMFVRFVIGRQHHDVIVRHRRNAKEIKLKKKN